MAEGQIQLYSESLQRPVSVSFLLPAPGRFNRERFPALLQLHGRYGSHTDWVTRTKLTVYIADLPLAVVVPDGAGAHAGWSNWRLPGQPFEAFIINDLMPACEHYFPIELDRWVIGGNSMGGYGALLLGLKYPERFVSVYAHSSALYSPERIQELQPDLAPQEQGDGDIRTHASRLADRADRPALGLDCGTGDRLIDHSRGLHAHLGEVGYPHSYEEAEGGHTWEYWDRQLPRALEQHRRALDI